MLAAAGFVPGEDGGFDGMALAAAIWLGLAVTLLILASVAPLVVPPQPYGAFLYERRSVFGLIGVNMLAAAAVCYLVVGTS